MFDPQRPILVERGNALGGRHELGTALCRGSLHDLDNRLFGRPVAAPANAPPRTRQPNGHVEGVDRV